MTYAFSKLILAEPWGTERLEAKIPVRRLLYSYKPKIMMPGKYLGPRNTKELTVRLITKTKRISRTRLRR